jgi:hypothetical protein
VNASASLGFLVGDANPTRTVTASDILRAKGQVGQPVIAPSARLDIDASGLVDSNDLDLIRQSSGRSL